MWQGDGDLGRELDSFADTTKSRKLGYCGFRQTDESWLFLYEKLRAARVNSLTTATGDPTTHMALAQSDEPANCFKVLSLRNDRKGEC